MWQQLRERLAENRPGARQGAWVTVLVGVALWSLPLGEGFVHWSFDLPTLLRPAQPQNEVLLLQLDQPSLTELRGSYRNFSRTNYANLLEKLAAAPARLVVFDVVFSESEPRAEEDPKLAEAIAANGRVVLAADHTIMADFAAGVVGAPLEVFRSNALSWGVARVLPDSDHTIRRHDPGPENCMSLAWAAARALKAPVTDEDERRLQHRWLRYYGGEGALPGRSLYVALAQAPEVFRDKIVFVGGKPATRMVNEEADEFFSPHTRWGGPLISGMEVQATTFLNLLHRDWLRRLPAIMELGLLVLCGIVLGAGLSLLRPQAGLVAALGAALAAALIGCLLFWWMGVWFSWLLIAGAEAPCAWACGALWNLRRLQRERAVIEDRFAAAKAGLALLTPGSDPKDAAAGRVSVPQPLNPAPAALAGQRVPAQVADHALLRRVGKGAYGEVFLARNAVGLYHAVKVVHRDNFPQEEPYEREFRGIQKYMPVSLGHPGLMPLLHVGRNDPAGYFYYVMELGDDRSGSGKINPDTYEPRNLAEELKHRGGLPVASCLEMFLTLADALDYLHHQNLVHRDIKPSNIIFAKGVPRFADIGLVTDIATTGRDVSYVGTEGYIPPEGPGTPAADVFSLGMVVYQTVTGLDRRRFPELPESLTQRPDMDLLIALNRIVLKACQPESARRYQSAAEMRADLARLRQQIAG